jgi:hypothetical protein
MLNKYEDQFFERNGLKPLEHIPHFTEAEREKYRVVSNHSWYKQVGNQIFCKCEIGEHMSQIPTDKILMGTDKNGLPIFDTIKI